MTVTITLKQLKSLDACKEQLKLFEEVFGDTVSFKTKAQATKVAIKMAHKFDFAWASGNLLGGVYRKAYEEAKVPLWEAYEEAEAPLWKAYEEAIAAYKESKDPLWKAYKEAKVPLLKAYKEAVAKEFAKCYFDQEEQNHS